MSKANLLQLLYALYTACKPVYRHITVCTFRLQVYVVFLVHPGCFDDPDDNIYVDAFNLLFADVLDCQAPV